MATLNNQNGSQTATLTTEHTLGSAIANTALGLYRLSIDANALANGETLTLRAYAKARSGDTARLIREEIYTNALGIPDILFPSDAAIPNTEQLDFRLRQDGGTGRTYTWVIAQVDGLQTGDAYAEATNASYGLSKLVRSTTPANTLDVSATGEAGLDFNNIKDASAGHTLTNITVPVVTDVTNGVSLANGAITTAKFAAGAVDAAALATDAANEIADAALDRANAIETGLTLRQALRLIAAEAAGKLAVSGSTNTFNNAVADTKARITATVDSNGQRTAITWDVT